MRYNKGNHRYSPLFSEFSSYSLFLSQTQCEWYPRPNKSAIVNDCYRESFFLLCFLRFPSLGTEEIVIIITKCKINADTEDLEWYKKWEDSSTHCCITTSQTGTLVGVKIRLYGCNIWNRELAQELSTWRLSRYGDTFSTHIRMI